ncbi:hypothetical protein [Parvibaculum sp.]|jgi:hypothetical protein|uniref:hypothetical protein n=1 Tax=Parvibaculum sp. TaxID=2024848 RepID=UPI001B2ED330|nr:hypothetical protein [Parvibaculum sp.]MBO6633297.1 hypothetical protein [Parvibaculum sp.]MBO6678334.1 hypothetical protein [Parvibaculum sp.]MBO6685298.1 hypothetical protein [Parvibaculum sp.]MBO6904655.1 hypothetical protein [Parvibaculum sp.]
MVDRTAEQTQPPVDERVFRLRPTGISSLLWAASFTVIALGLFREWYVAAFGLETLVQDLRHIAFNAEHCLPAWYTSLLLALSAAILAIVTASAARNGENYLFHWAILTLIFIGLSIDEATGVHEVAIEPLRESLGLSGFLHFAWVIPGMVLVALAGLAYLPFLLAQPARTRAIFLTAGILYVGGALGMEIVGGKVLTIHGEESLAYVLAFCTEEIMEILGATLFAAGLLGHLKRRFGGAVLIIA